MKLILILYITIIWTALFMIVSSKQMGISKSLIDNQYHLSIGGNLTVNATHFTKVFAGNIDITSPFLFNTIALKASIGQELYRGFEVTNISNTLYNFLPAYRAGIVLTKSMNIPARPFTEFGWVIKMPMNLDGTNAECDGPYLNFGFEYFASPYLTITAKLGLDGMLYTNEFYQPRIINENLYLNGFYFQIGTRFYLP